MGRPFDRASGDFSDPLELQPVSPAEAEHTGLHRAQPQSIQRQGRADEVDKVFTKVGASVEMDA